MEQTPKSKIYLFLKPYTGKKDGKQQLMLRVKIGKPNLGKTQYDIIVDIKMLAASGEIMKLTQAEFQNRNSNPEIMHRFYEVIGFVNRAIMSLSYEKKVIDAKNLFTYTYEVQEKLIDGDDLIDNEDVRKFFDNPVPKEVWEAFNSEVYLDDLTGEPVLYEDLEDIAKGIEGAYYGEKHRREIEEMDYLERYEKGQYDKENIFDCFGFCWTLDKLNNDMLIAESYKSLLLRLHDYRYNENPPEHVKYFNDEWIQNFLKFLVQNGYSTFRPRNYMPFGFDQYSLRLINAERKGYRFAGFDKIVKHLKRYIFLLQKHKIISYQRNPDFIDSKDYVSRKVITTAYTRREHSLTLEEFDLFCKTDYNNDEMNLARDMFILACLGGGFRGEELYNHELSLEKRDAHYLLHIYHSKTTFLNINPVFGELENVIDRHSGKLPEFLTIVDFRKGLSKIAKKLNYDRVIISPNTLLDAQERTEKFILKDIFSVYFARKTLVMLLDSYGFTDEEIIEFTAHTKTETLNYYKPKLSLPRKQKALEAKGLWK